MQISSNCHDTTTLHERGRSVVSRVREFYVYLRIRPPVPYRRLSVLMSKQMRPRLERKTRKIVGRALVAASNPSTTSRLSPHRTTSALNIASRIESIAIDSLRRSQFAENFTRHHSQMIKGYNTSPRQVPQRFPYPIGEFVFLSNSQRRYIFSYRVQRMRIETHRGKMLSATFNHLTVPFLARSRKYIPFCKL